jgi:hypothetical protein
MPSNWSRYSQPVGDVKSRLLKRCRQEDRGFDTFCLIWYGEHDKEGYGKIKDGGKYVPTHWVLKGKPPEGMQSDHLCHQRDCCRPSHLEFVSPSENTNRRAAKSETVDDIEAAKISAKYLLSNGHSVATVASVTGLSRRTVGRIKAENATT